MNDTKNFVFLPGWGFYPKIFCSFAEQFNGVAKFMTLPPINTSGDSFDQMILPLAESIPARSIIIAWSLGGLIALKLCALFPNLCERLLLIATTPRFVQNKHWKGMDESVINQFLNLFQFQFNHCMHYFIDLTNYPNKDKHIKQLIHSCSILSNHDYDKKSLLCYLKLLFYTDLRQEYSNLTTPTLHLLGDRDGVVTVDSKQLAQLNINVKISTIKHSGHAPFLTHLNECITVIEHFLKDV
jgi:pimeloyl-[acyl-carrier protein] methyl ester esterase